MESPNRVPTPWHMKPAIAQATARSIAAGLFIGSVVLVSNFQFGLQSGWVSMMSLPSSLLGFAIFKTFAAKLLYPFSDVENVFVQSVAVAVGTGPLAYGLVGIVPAIEKFMTPEESGVGHTIRLNLLQLFVWCIGIGFFGVFFSIPLRNQVILKEKLPFPSGSATATLISVLHDTEILDETKPQVQPIADEEASMNMLDSPEILALSHSETYQKNMYNLLVTFAVSSAYTVLSYFVPQLRSIPIFGSRLSRDYLWNLQPSPAYIGQGIIMGLPTVSYMLFGAVLGWAVLAPLAKHMGWSPGQIDDWKEGGQGWILWISLAAMVADSVASFVVVTTKSLWHLYQKHQAENQYHPANRLLGPVLRDDSSNENPENSTFDRQSVGEEFGAASENLEIDKMEPEFLVSNKTTYTGLAVSSVLCVACVRYVFGPVIPIFSIVVALLIAFFLSILGVRALGETDLNPVSGIGKISQLIFAFVIPKDQPGAVLINLVAGGIAEAGAQQAGDLMQDLKTGHLVGASPKAQFIAQMIGSFWLILLSGVMYRVYDSVYEIPGKVFRIPTAIIWIDCSRLVTGQGLPPHALTASIVVGVIFACISLAKNLTPMGHWFHGKLVYLPSGVAVGIGIYNTPSFTIARFAGGLASWWWIRRATDAKGTVPLDARISMIVFSSGLVLGEGMLSCVTMLMTSLGVPHF
ncbi:hypothetical protein BABINDRAFT_163612 [Babjeviella inositovora NRRL Y-12698]|uniref:OPT superfamily oligopeptide transporter n=1 Tax=Babjeviella inositovora NRRL Y-12698 TaxID=984486 RepID=A0A1E3QI30_9ASCO|nr:uncharacterized protein BABINDRAFT_163612 [Babjeviella inositovora NRRL Y-12698]ODQ77355.1 hypothetical protein BABINDRAFT_163612 [Babjeviella inositovora NRRL Y-12698]